MPVTLATSSRDSAVHTDEGTRSEENSEGGGIALSAFALMIMTGVSASADDEKIAAQASIVAIDELVGTVRSDAVEMSAADMTVTTGGATVELSSDASDGVAIEGPGGADLGVGLPFAGQSDEAAIVDGTVVYDNNNGTTTTPLIQDDGSVQILTTIADSSSPTTFEYPLDVPEGASLVLTPDGGARVAGADGATVAAVAAPWAVDAEGASVETWYEVDGDTLVQVIAHRVSATAYPVVADPSISFGWAIYIKYNRSETVRIAGYSAYATLLNGVCPFLLFGTPVAYSVCAAALGVHGVSIDNTFNNAATSGKCVQFSEPYYPALPTMVAQLRWKVVTC